ncbi:hypothetical protein D3C74_464740 [compost metagenome]
MLQFFLLTLQQILGTSERIRLFLQIFVGAAELFLLCLQFLRLALQFFCKRLGFPQQLFHHKPPADIVQNHTQVVRKLMQQFILQIAER